MGKIQFNNSPRKLIVLFNLSGSYKGGAQRRYLALFNYFQQINRQDYFLLLNESLYAECFKDNILTMNKNVLCVPVKYGKKILPKNNDILLGENTKSISITIKDIGLYNLLGSISSFLKQFRSWVSYSLQLIKIIKKFNIEIIYGIFTGGVWSWQIAKLLNIKFIYSYNDSTTAMIEKKLLKILNSEYYPLKFADKIDFLSQDILDNLKEKGLNIKKKRILISPNSFIIYDKFYPEFPKKNWIVFSGRMTKIKNPRLLLEAISILKERGFAGFDAYFLGEGILLPELLEQKEEFNLDNVYFEGGVSDTSKYLKKSTIFISIQTDNNYPSQSLLEAMACENAIIASDVGETRKIITENEGILVPLDSDKIAEAIYFLLDHSNECKRLGRNARLKAISEHNIEKYSNYFFDITKN